MRVPTEFEIQFYFLAMDFMSRKVGKKKLNIFRDVVNSTLEGIAV